MFIKNIYLLLNYAGLFIFNGIKNSFPIYSAQFYSAYFYKLTAKNGYH